MKKLLLFDVDRTLIVSTIHDNRFARAINNKHGSEIEYANELHGSTDSLVLRYLLEREGWDTEQIKIAMPELLEELDKVHAETFNTTNYMAVPGIKKLLKALSKTDTVLGLITGNVESIAKRKLEAVGIWSYFSLGGYSSDPHIVRSDLVSLAIKRAGFENNNENVYVLGDTPLDIQAAHEAGISNSVGVSNGFCSIKELQDAGAKIVFENFKNTQDVLEKLEIE
jgi:phosphoglycolate phosphatase